MIYRVEVCTKEAFRGTRSASLLRRIDSLGIGGLQAVLVTDLYFLHGNLADDVVQRLVDELLYDPVVEDVQWYPQDAAAPNNIWPNDSKTWQIEVTLLPGVTDSVAESLLDGAQMIGVRGLQAAATGQRYSLMGDIEERDVRRIANRLLVNEVIQTFTLNAPIAPPFMLLAGQGAGVGEGQAGQVEQPSVRNFSEAEAVGPTSITHFHSRTRALTRISKPTGENI